MHPFQFDSTRPLNIYCKNSQLSLEIIKLTATKEKEAKKKKKQHYAFS